MINIAVQTNLIDLEEAPKTIASLKKVKDRVKFILERYPQTRGDDVLLLYRYYWWFERDRAVLKPIHFKALLSLTSPESITRCRRKIQETGLLTPTKETILKRRRREKVISNGMATGVI